MRFVMYEVHVVSGGYMICDPQGNRKCVIYDGEFADQIVDALNYPESGESSDADLQIDEIREVFAKYKEAVEKGDKGKQVEFWDELEAAIES